MTKKGYDNLIPANQRSKAEQRKNLLFREMVEAERWPPITNLWPEIREKEMRHLRQNKRNNYETDG